MIVKDFLVRFLMEAPKRIANFRIRLRLIISKISYVHIALDDIFDKLTVIVFKC